MGQVPVFLINLDTATHRLAAMKRQFDALLIDYERVPAIIGKNLGESELLRIAPPEFWLGKRPPVPGEVGCFLSHRLVMGMIVERRLPRACILEDDVCLSADFAKFLDEDLTLPPDADVLKLELVGPPPKLRYIAAGEIAGRTLAFFPAGGWPGTAAYIVTAAGARELFQDMRRMVHMYDSQAFDYARNGVMTYHVVPLPAYQSEDSEIGRPGKLPKEPRFTLGWIQAKIKKRLREAHIAVGKLNFQFRRFGVAKTLFGKTTISKKDLVRV